MMPILILAAGGSARMRGVDKLLEQVDGIPLLRRQTQMALRVSDDVRVALPPRPHLRYDAINDLPARTIDVPNAAEGMNASLCRIFSTLDASNTHAMLLLADLPDITCDDLNRVAASVAEHPDALIWRGATESGKGGHPMILDASLFGRFAELTGDSGGQSVVKAAGSRVHHLTLPGIRARRDLDTPEDWAAWRAART